MRNIITIFGGYNNLGAINSHQVDELYHIPRVGEYFEFWSVRNEKGEYIGYGNNKHYPLLQAEKKFAGIVLKVEHIFEEHGRDASSHEYRHFINIYLDKNGI